MQFGLYCVECMVRREVEHAHEFGDAQAGLRYLRDVLQELAQSPSGVSAAYLQARFAELQARHYGLCGDRYLEIKRESNRWMLERLPAIRARVEQADDPLYTALLYARCGNYLDFAALGNRVNERELDELLAAAADDTLDAAEYRHFCDELRQAERFLLLTDNAGEIVFDKLLCEILHARYPKLHLTVGVRGGPTMNDALREDAAQIGLHELTELVDSGCAICGTELDYIGDEMRRAIDGADVILAKGMGNFEAMFGCEKNVYYLFLCKCKRLCQMLDAALMQGMFLNDRRAQISVERQMA